MNQSRRSKNIRSHFVPSSKGPALATVVLFHGYGADMMDLAPLQEVLDPEGKFQWFFPQGLFEVPIGPGWIGRGWWHLDLTKLTPGRDLSDEVPEQISEVRFQMEEFIRSIGVPSSQLILGGFSQGGMLALDLCLSSNESPLGLVLLSTALFEKKELSSKAPNHSGLNFFLSHGHEDPVLDFKNAQRLESFLIQNKLKGKLDSFYGQHEIPNQILDKLKLWMNERIKK